MRAARPRAVCRQPAPGTLVQARSSPAAASRSPRRSSRSAPSPAKSRPSRSTAGTAPAGCIPAATPLRRRQTGSLQIVAQYLARMAWIQHRHDRRSPSFNGSPQSVRRNAGPHPVHHRRQRDAPHSGVVALIVKSGSGGCVGVSATQRFSSTRVGRGRSIPAHGSSASGVHVPVPGSARVPSV